jgi:AraC-like DNA-binding protein
MVMWPVASDLAPYLSGYQLYVVGETYDDPHRGAFEPACASLRIAVTGGSDWRLRRLQEDWTIPPQVSLFGPSSELVWSESGPGVLIGAGIRPRGWPRLFGRPAWEWADRIGAPPFAGQRTQDLFHELFSKLADDSDVPRAFDQIFRQILRPATGDDAAIGKLESALVDPAIASVAELAEVTGLSLRSLQRLADRAFGFPPKLLLRRARFLRSLHAMRATARGEGARTIDSGYTDYSHFVRDSHDFLGMSPQAFLERDMPLLKRSLDLRTRVLGTPAQALDPAPD